MNKQEMQAMSHEIAPATMRELRSVLIRWAIVLAALGAFALWATWRMSTAASRLPASGGPIDSKGPSSEPAIDYWTCTMHPEIRQPEEGRCPICGMSLVAKYVGSEKPGLKPVAEASGGREHAGSSRAEGKPEAWYRCTMPECGDQGSDDPNSRCPVCGMKRERVDTGGAGAGDFEITLSPRARRLAEVETELAERRLLYKRIRTVGRVSYDETLYKMVSAWIDGRIDKLFADFSGMTVSQGDHLVEIYSPELLSAQEEFLQALRTFAAARDSQTAVSRRSSEQVLQSARRKLELLGVTEDQIQALERSGETRTRLVVHAPIGGTIVEKHVMEGMYVETGDALYTIADLQHLWLLVDLYESDLPWVRPFQEVLVATRSLPGEVFTGQIVFIDPRVDPQTRTVPVRVHVDNPALRLKPDMWVTAQIDAGLSRGGRGAVPAPSGAFACPMHPWETANELAPCPLCEMDMVRAEQLPQYSSPTEAAPVLSVPRDAVMQTGQRALVYIETAPGAYRGVEVTVGPLASDERGREHYPILAGLSGGERVVTRGNFAIDSQMQLAGKPSLFSARGVGDHQHQDTAAQQADHATHGSADDKGTKQTICPVMDNEINPDVFIEYKGVKVYFCCWGCDDKFLAEPEKYIPKLPPTVQQRIRAAEKAAPPDSDAPGNDARTTGPIIEHSIDKMVYAASHGVFVHSCCPRCIARSEAVPDTRVPALPSAIPVKLCSASVRKYRS
jgi:Cu(I)/Ag(I) efflux system membrane fusion protein